MNVLLHRLLVPGLGAAGLLLVALVAPASPVRGQDTTQSLAIDTDPGSAPCTNVHRTRTVRPGEDFQVGICLQQAAGTIGVMQMDIVYDDTVLLAPEVPDTGAALDDNPDANQVGLSGVSSGDFGWDCTGLAVAYPKGDKDPATGPGHGVGYLGCFSVNGPYGVKKGDSLWLALMRFQALAPGQTTIELQNVQLANDAVMETGSCNPPITLQMECSGGVVTVEATAPATPTPPGAGPTAAPPDTTPPILQTLTAGTPADQTPAFTEGTPAAPTSAAQTAAAATPTPAGSAAGASQATAAAATVAAGGGTSEMKTAVAAGQASSAVQSGDGGGVSWWMIALPVVVVVGVAGGGLYWLRFRRA